MDQTFCGDGSELVQGRVGMGVKSAVMGGDGTKIPSPCTPLLQTPVQFMCCGRTLNNRLCDGVFALLTVPQQQNELILRDALTKLVQVCIHPSHTHTHAHRCSPWCRIVVKPSWFDLHEHESLSSSINSLETVQITLLRRTPSCSP